MNKTRLFSGVFPKGELIAHEGTLWGMTCFGRSGKIGSLFKIEKDGSTFEKLMDFNSPLRGVPYGQLIEVVGDN